MYSIYISYSICSSSFFFRSSRSPNVIEDFASLVFSVRSPPVSNAGQQPSLVRTNSEDQGSVKAKDQSPNPDKDKVTAKKSSHSGEEADKDIILM